MRKVSLRSITGLAAVAALTASVILPTLAAGGMLKIKGSDTVLPLSSAWAEAYMKKHPDAMVAVNGGGSGVGFASLINGSCEIANASREAKPKEIGQARDRNVTLKAIPVARDGIAVIVNPKNSIKNLSMAEVGKLYSSAHNWKEVGGENMKVVAAGRDSSSGTYVFFQDKVLGGRRYRNDMLTLPSNNAICDTVARTEGAVGYVGLAFAKEYVEKGKIRILPISSGKGQALAASDETVLSGKYPLFRYLYCYTNGKPKGLSADYLKFALSKEGQNLVEKVGYVRVK